MDGTRWRKSTRSGSTSDCVEMARDTEQAGVRDSKNPSGPKLAFSVRGVDAFLSAVKDGRLDG